MTTKLAKHTPGPWTAMLDADGDSAIYSGDVLLAVTSGNPDMSLAEDEANADLMAAAPAMLEALEECAEWIRAMAAHEVQCSANVQAYVKARNAIHAAVGEQEENTHQ